MISIGSSAIARARATRRAIPPDSEAGISAWAPRRPTASSFISTRSRIISSDRSVCSRKGKATLSNTDRSVNSAPNWNSIPIRRRRRYNSASDIRQTWCFSRRTLPPVGFNCPPMQRNRVVLPHPEPPMMATTLPRGICMSMPCSTGLPSYWKWRFWMSTRMSSVNAHASEKVSEHSIRTACCDSGPGVSSAKQFFDDKRIK